MEKFKFLRKQDGLCHECGARFPNAHLQAKADAHEKEHPGFRHALTSCAEHNYGATAVFERDIEF